AQGAPKIRCSLAIVDKAGNVLVQNLLDSRDLQARQEPFVISLITAYRTFCGLEVCTQELQPRMFNVSLRVGDEVGGKPVTLILPEDGTVFRRLRPWKVDRQPARILKCRTQRIGSHNDLRYPGIS